MSDRALRLMARAKAEDAANWRLREYTMRSEFYFDDFKVGETFKTYSVTVTDGAIIDFAMRWDPYDFHVSTEAARKHPLGLDTVFASGFHTLCLSFRLFSQTGVLRDCAISGGGIDGLRWFKPVVPGDTIHAEVEVIATRASKSNHQRGVVTLHLVNLYYTSFFGCVNVKGPAF